MFDLGEQFLLEVWVVEFLFDDVNGDIVLQNLLSDLTHAIPPRMGRGLKICDFLILGAFLATDAPLLKFRVVDGLEVGQDLAEECLCLILHDLAVDLDEHEFTFGVTRGVLLYSPFQGFRIAEDLVDKLHYYPLKKAEVSSTGDKSSSK